MTQIDVYVCVPTIQSTGRMRVLGGSSHLFCCVYISRSFYLRRGLERVMCPVYHITHAFIQARIHFWRLNGAACLRKRSRFNPKNKWLLPKFCPKFCQTWILWCKCVISPVTVTTINCDVLCPFPDWEAELCSSPVTYWAMGVALGGGVAKTAFFWFIGVVCNLAMEAECEGADAGELCMLAGNCGVVVQDAFCCADELVVTLLPWVWEGWSSSVV